MRLYFVRHADALPGENDDIRPLSERGQEDSRRLGRYLAGLGVRFEAAYSSPLVRARETAEIILEACAAGKKTKVQLADALRNEAGRAEFKDWLRGLPQPDHVLLVGHAPTLAERVRRLLGMDDPMALDLAKGALACLETDDCRNAQLKLFLAPKHLP